MGLLDLKTDLKSLKFGNDRFNGGSSNQPYIKSSIPDKYGDVIKFDDGLIRGGVIQSSKSAINDTIRITKFFTDFPKGPLFITKQVGLQLTNPKLETKPIGKIKGESFITNTLNKGVDLLNKLGPTRVYNLGINTLAQIPVGHLGTHFERHGYTPIQNEQTKYYSVVKNKSKEDNRLVLLKDKLLPTEKNTKEDKQWFKQASEYEKKLSQTYSWTTKNSIIDEYIGGPNSTYGIGKTTIKRYDYTPKQFELDEYISIKQNTIEDQFENNRLIIDQYDNQPLSYPGDEKPNVVSATNYNTELKLSQKKKDQFIQNRLGLGNPGKRNRDRSAYNISDPNTIDKINALGIFYANQLDEDKQSKSRDMVKFRFEAIDTDNPNYADFIFFRAFLTNIGMDYSSNRNAIKYAGRGESFYIYDSFSSNINFNFKIAAQSRDEMKPLYQKLNYLISNLAPDYKNNRMRGPLLRLTIGDLVVYQPGFITSLKVTVPENASWEIALDEPENGLDKDMYELPQVLDVSCNFTPIYNFLPQKSLTRSPFLTPKDKNKWLEELKNVRQK